jgi:hypothetical protein
MQRIPADARLPSSYDDKEIGYRVLTLGRGEFVPFTVEGVTLSMPRCWSVAGGVDAPDGGGYIVWGLADEDLAEAGIEPVVPDLTDAVLFRMRTIIDTAISRIIAVMPATPVIQMDTSAFDLSIKQLDDKMSAVSTDVELRTHEQGKQVSEIQTRLAELATSYAGLKATEDVTRQLSALTAMRDRLSEVIGDKPQAITIVHESNTAQLATVLETVRADIERLSGDRETARQETGRQKRTLQVLDTFLQKVGG